MNTASTFQPSYENRSFPEIYRDHLLVQTSNMKKNFFWSWERAIRESKLSRWLILGWKVYLRGVLCDQITLRLISILLYFFTAVLWRKSLICRLHQTCKGLPSLQLSWLGFLEVPGKCLLLHSSQMSNKAKGGCNPAIARDRDLIRNLLTWFVFPETIEYLGLIATSSVCVPCIWVNLRQGRCQRLLPSPPRHITKWELHMAHNVFQGPWKSCKFAMIFGGESARVLFNSGREQVKL